MSFGGIVERLPNLIVDYCVLWSTLAAVTMRLFVEYPEEEDFIPCEYEEAIEAIDLMYYGSIMFFGAMGFTMSFIYTMRSIMVIKYVFKEVLEYLIRTFKKKSILGFSEGHSVETQTFENSSAGFDFGFIDNLNAESREFLFGTDVSVEVEDKRLEILALQSVLEVLQTRLSEQVKPWSHTESMCMGLVDFGIEAAYIGLRIAMSATNNIPASLIKEITECKDIYTEHDGMVQTIWSDLLSKIRLPPGEGQTSCEQTSHLLERLDKLD